MPFFSITAKEKNPGSLERRLPGFPFIIPTRSCQKFSKQICLWGLAQSIGIIFIIQIVGAI